MRRAAVIAALAIAFLAGCGTSPDATSTATSTATVTVTEAVTAAEEDVAADAEVLVPSDFEIDLKIKEKKCFGSAGCIVTYEIDPRYSGGSVEDLGDGSWDVTYEVTGGEDGPIVNTFTVDSGQVSFDGEEIAGTSSQGVELAARATEVISND